jgi:transcriptional regulator GlxA family with amidase domain
MSPALQIVVFDGFDEIDVFGPCEILSSAGFTVRLTSLAGSGMITSMRGIPIKVDQQLSTCDGLIVPGGGWLNRASSGGWAEVQRGDLPQRLVELSHEVDWMASVCSGGMILASAGLLADHAATTNRNCYEEFRPLVGEVIDERVVEDRNRISAGALFSGVDLGLAIVERELGTTAADRVADGVEYRRDGRVWRAGRRSHGVG